MHLKSKTVQINKSSEEIFNFLSDVGNFKQIMPESIQKFEKINQDRFLFQLKGMPEIILEKKEETPFQELIFGAVSDKIPFTLKASICNLEVNKSEFHLDFDGVFNAMMSMMIKSPIQNFINTLSDNMEQL